MHEKRERWVHTLIHISWVMTHKKRAIGFTYHGQVEGWQMTMKHVKISKVNAVLHFGLYSRLTKTIMRYPTLHFHINWFLWAPFLLPWAPKGCHPPPLRLFFYIKKRKKKKEEEQINEIICPQLPRL